MPDKSFLFKRPPLWSAHETAAQRQLTPELQSWLNETGSLTKRLRGIYGNRFGVELLFHRWKPAFNDECRLLALPPARYQLIREVLLHADGRPLVLARTVLPDPTIKIAHRNLSHLGNRPLGKSFSPTPTLNAANASSAAPSRTNGRLLCKPGSRWQGQLGAGVRNMRFTATRCWSPSFFCPRCCKRFRRIHYSNNLNTTSAIVSNTSNSSPAWLVGAA